jgi:hypothetical protein
MNTRRLLANKEIELEIGRELLKKKFGTSDQERSSYFILNIRLVKLKLSIWLV